MQKIKEFLINILNEFLTNTTINFLETIFSDVNNQVNSIGVEVGKTPSEWNPSIWAMIVDVAQSVIVPIAGIILTYIFCIEVISAVADKNSMRDFDTTEFLFKLILKLFIAIIIINHTHEITMGLFDAGAYVVAQSAGRITGDTTVDIGISLEQVRTQLMAMPPTLETSAHLVKLCITSFIVSWAMKAISIVISVIVIGRMIEIYMYCSIGPIPFATFINKEWGSIGQNYLKSLAALAFQGFLMMICLGVYAVLAHNLSISGGDLEKGLFDILIISVVLCFTLLKSSSVAKSIFGAH